MSFPDFNPPPPGQITIRQFQELRQFLLDYVVNRWMQYVTNYLTGTLIPPLNAQLADLEQRVAKLEHP